MINKVCPDSAAAVADIQDGSVIMVGGFGDAGVELGLGEGDGGLRSGDGKPVRLVARPILGGLVHDYRLAA